MGSNFDWRTFLGTSCSETALGHSPTTPTSDLVMRAFLGQFRIDSLCKPWVFFFVVVLVLAETELIFFLVPGTVLS